MKKKYIIIIITAVILIGSTVGFICLKNSKTMGNSNKPQYYKVSNVEKVFINGVIKPKENEKILLDATKGSVFETYVKDGQTVNEGDKLFSYNNESIATQIEQLNYQIKSNEASKANLNDKVYDAQARLQEKQSELNKLPKIENTIETALEYNNNEANKATIEGNIVQIESEISAYQDQISTVKLSLDSLYEQKTNLEEKQYHTVTAPISGKVTLSSDNTSMATPYITIESQNLIIEGTISERDFTKVKVGDAISVLVIPTNKTVEGKLSFISDRPVENTVVQSSQTTNNANLSYYDVKIELNSQDDLVNGFHSQGKITLGDSTIKVPKTSILEEEGKQYVFVKVDNSLKKREVTLGETIGEEVVVKSGVEENDEVMENPTVNTKEGIAVE